MVASGEKLLKDMNQVSALGSTPEASVLLTHQTAANEEPKKKGAFQITDVRQGQEATDISFGDTTILEEEDDDDDVANEEEAAGQEGVSVKAQSSETGTTYGGQNDLSEQDAKSLQRFRVVRLQENLVNDERGRWQCHDVLERSASNGTSSAESSCITGEQSPISGRRNDLLTSSSSVGPIVTSTPTTSGSAVTRGHASEVCARHRDDALTCNAVKDDVSELPSLSRQVSVEGSRDSGADSPELESNVDSTQSSHRSLHEAAASSEHVTASEHVPESSRLHPVCEEDARPTRNVFMGQFETLLANYVTGQTGQLEGKNRELERQIERLQGKLKSLENDNKELQEQNSSLQQQKASLEQDYSNLQEENSSLRRQVEGRDPVQ